MSTEVVEEIDVRYWHQGVLETYKGRCANCGSDHKVEPRLVVPQEVGGKRTLSNSTLLCRACELASGLATKEDNENRRIVNLWVSRRLYDRLHAQKDDGKITSMGSLVRFLMSQYVEDQSRYDDLAQYQDGGTDVRLNVWVDADLYVKFKAAVDEAGHTVTSTIKSLFCLYETDLSRRERVLAS